MKSFNDDRHIVGRKYEIKKENDLIYHLSEVALVWENLKGNIEISNNVYPNTRKKTQKRNQKKYLDNNPNKENIN